MKSTSAHTSREINGTLTTIHLYGVSMYNSNNSLVSFLDKQ